MKLFISWSGNVSHEVAVTLRGWLPGVIQSIDAFVSSEDIEKGMRWSERLAQELAGTNFGIICVTPDNVNRPWLNFEAGALSRLLGENTRLMPFVFGMSKTDLTGPLVQFQVTANGKADIRKLVATLNRACEDSALEEQHLEDAFETYWPRLETALKKVEQAYNAANPGIAEKIERSEREILAEILDIVRSMQLYGNDPYLGLGNPMRGGARQFISDAFKRGEPPNQVYSNLIRREGMNPAEAAMLVRETWRMFVEFGPMDHTLDNEDHSDDVADLAKD